MFQRDVLRFVPPYNRMRASGINRQVCVVEGHLFYRSHKMIVPYVVLIVTTVVEIFSLTWLGMQISVLNTISLTMFTLLLGVINGRSYGEEWYEKMQWHLKSGTLPSDDVVNGAVMNVGSKLLLMPGLVTDVLGFLIILPQTRFIAKKFALGLFKKKLSRQEQWFFFQQ